MQAQELRQKFLDFFKSKGHAIIPSASLIPENDPTTLFTTAGMHPLVPFLMGEKHPQGNKLVGIQKCVRTTDIDEVGNTTHHTFFEMLGNWSLGDPASPDGVRQGGYWKKQAIEWSQEFLISPQWLNLDKNRLAISVFKGGKDAPFDEEAYQTWLSLGVPKARIAKLGEETNWWGPAGVTGPCGPCTEMFYWVGDENKIPKSFNDDNDLWVEIWNDVFMEYDKKKDKSYTKLARQNVDTGMGLERTLAVLNNLDDNYLTDLFKNLINKIEWLSGKKYQESKDVTRAMRIVVDHLKAATFIMGDNKGITPSNVDQGYVVRRLIRRSIRYGRQLGIKEQSWTKEIAKIVVHDYFKNYPELKTNVNFIIEQLDSEETKFRKTLAKGLKEFNKIIKKEYISGAEAFDLYQTYGFPLELTEELAAEQKLKVNKENFYQEFKKHQELSRTASAGKFKGGLADASEETKKLHTAAHLLLAALRKVLGDHVVQKGSNITSERLRFDFSHPKKLTLEEKQQVEKLINQAIAKNLTVACEEMDLEQAKQEKAMGVFEAKYHNKVKVYSVGEGKEIFSKEICGGPHVEKTGKLGYFKIKKEQSSSAGVRRIKAILE